MAQDKNFLLETRSIDFIPTHLRHGKASDLFFFWFGANAQMAVIATGLIALVPGFSLWWAVVGIVLGTVVGSIFMAYHSAQGPNLGVPQMIQSRAQFGYYGAVVPLIMVVVMYLGFYASGAVIGAEAIAKLCHVSVSVGILLSSLAVMLLVLAGYNLMHKFNRVMSYFFSIVFLIVTCLLLFVPKDSVAQTHTHLSATSFQIGPFLLAISLAVINTLGYAPYVADYSRYLPQNTSNAKTFWFSYTGVLISNIWMMVLGAVVQSRTPTPDPITGFLIIGHTVGPWFSVFILLASALGIVSINALNIYGGFMSSLTIANTFFNKWKPTFALRVWFIIPITIVGTYLAFLEKGNLLGSFEAFLGLLIDFLVPWTAINLSDYYFLRRGKYVIDDFFNPHGRYGSVNWVSMTAYFLGIVVGVPFINTSFYEGPIAKLMHGGDISWMVEVVVAGILYLVLFRRFQADKEPSVGRDFSEVQTG